MDGLDTAEFWLLLAAAVAVGFMLGRASRGGEDADERRMRAELAASERFAALSSADQAEIDALVMSGKTLEAIRLTREKTGLGLKESKDAIDARRRTLKG